MPVHKDPSGRRWIAVEVEVPGTTEEVWQAIATGPGISSWFVPTEVEEREGGLTTSNYGPGMESTATITAWEPPHRFSADSRELGPDGPAIATEWIVEARSGSTCVVRVVHSLFADVDDWDDQLEAPEHGWPAFFRILRLYLEHFAGRAATAFQVMGMSSGSPEEAWASFTSALGIAGARAGGRVRSVAGAPALVGGIEHQGPAEYPELLLKLDQPAPGIAHLFAMDMGGQALLSVRLYLYGETAAGAVAREEAVWQTWIAERFPAGTAAPKC